MSSDMLDMITLADVAGLNADLNQRLLGADGQEWLKAYKRFLRKENPWVEAVPTVPVIQAALNRHIDCDAQPYVPRNDQGRSVFRMLHDADFNSKCLPNQITG